MPKSRKVVKAPPVGEELGLDVFMDIQSQMEETEDDVDLIEVDEPVIHVHREDDLQSDAELFFPGLNDRDKESNSGSDQSGADNSDSDGGDDTFDEEFNDFIDEEYLCHAIHLLSEDFQVIQCLLARRGRYVYKVRERTTNEVKVITISKDRTKDLRKSPEEAPREVTIMMHLKNTQGFAQIEAWGPLKYGCYFFITPFYAGVDILLCKKDRTLFAKVVRSLLEGLGELEAKGVSHRDIAPENIIINPLNPLQELVTIIDFDLSTWKREGGYRHDVGRHDYYPPEKVTVMKEIKHFLDKRDDPNTRPKHMVHPSKLPTYDDRADIYSVGCIMMYVITGKMPDNGMSEIKDEDVKNVEREHPHVKSFVKNHRNRQNNPPEIDLCLRMLDFDVNKRISLHAATNHPFIDLSEPEQYTEQYKLFETKVQELQQELEEARQAAEEEEGDEEEEEEDHGDDEEEEDGSDTESVSETFECDLDDEEEEDEDEEDDERKEEKSGALSNHLKQRNKTDISMLPKEPASTGTISNVSPHKVQNFSAEFILSLPVFSAPEARSFEAMPSAATVGRTGPIIELFDEKDEQGSPRKKE